MHDAGAATLPRQCQDNNKSMDAYIMMGSPTVSIHKVFAMTSINKLTQNTELKSSDLLPIWDAENSRTRSASMETISSYIINNTDVGLAYKSLTIEGGDLIGVRLNGETVNIGQVQ